MPKQNENEKILERARKRFAECLSAQAALRDNAIDDLKFARLGEQWSEGDKSMRGDRPMLTIDKVNVFNNYIINEIKIGRNKPKARPVDDKADVETAGVISSVIDNIYNDKGEDAMDTAIEGAVSCGMGFARLVTEYIGKTFNQKIRIKRISNPLRVVIPFHECEEADFSDMPYAFIITKYKKDDFKAEYPDVDLNGWASMLGEGMKYWQTAEDVTIAEYFERDAEKKTIRKDEENENSPVRQYSEYSVKWYTLCGSSVLDDGKWPGSYIPIIAVMGPEVDIDGEKSYISATRFAKDPQRFLNYAKSCEAEALGLAPKQPWIAAEGQIEGHEKMWKNANTTPYSTLVYKPKSVDGTLLPPPRRVEQASIPTAAVNASAEASNDMKETIGIWAANLGAPGNETSGRAIVARGRQGSTANFHYADNYNKALKFLGTQLLELIPKVMTQAQAIRIVGEDRKEEVVRVNERYSRNGKDVFYDLTAGEYDIVMDSGPSYATRRAEVEENLGNLMQRLPPTMIAAIADLYVRNMDFPDATAAADRLKRLAPPEALQDDSKLPPAPVLVQKLQQAMAINRQYAQVIEKMQLEIESKDRDREQKTDLALLNSETQIEIAKIKAGLEEMKVNSKLLADQISKLASDNREPAPAQNAEIPPESGEIGE